MKSFLFRICFLIAAAGFGAASVQAQDLGAVRARMEQRQGSIDALRDRHAVGENNRGFVDPRGPINPDEQRMISDENSDRRAVYVALAEQTRTDPDTVGRKRAQQIAERSKRGVWIQTPTGEWIQKG